MTVHTYIPQDRLRAIVMGASLPDRTSGSALFADISGFTAFTEGLRNTLGPRRGAEELARRIETIYSELITQIEQFGGSVIDFAGDSMLCWFDEDVSRTAEVVSLDAASQPSAAHRAVACGAALQRAMQAFDKIVLPDRSTTSLSLKVAIASGAARRFVVGDPKIRMMDVVAGGTIARTAAAEHLAWKGEVIIDEATINILGEGIIIQEWRETEEKHERFAVVSRADWQSDLLPVLPQWDAGDLVSEKLHPWVHTLLVEREGSGQVAFMTEFRPCVAMFVRFSGIDFDQDSAGPQLDAFICQAQAIVARHGGTFLQLTVGDKGSYAYINFGALNAHENDARRAVNTALALMETSALPLQIGITQGLMRVGAYGGETRKTFGALGDDVNLAARLMMTAKTGEIMLSGHVHKVVADQFTFEPRPPLPMKGKAELLPVFAVTGERQQRAIRLQEPTYALPMVGRTEELQLINNKLDLTAKGQGQVIGIVAEAGLGKSRLVAEVIRSARRKAFIGYGGACQSDGIHTPYLAWKSIWGAFFDVNPDVPLRKQMRNIEGEIEDRAPNRIEAMPLLNAVLDLDIPENDFTQNLEPKIRQSALHALLEDCLKSTAKDEPILIVLEDLHWIDALSHDLLEELAKALANHAVCFVLAYRPAQLKRLQAPRLEALPQFTKIELHELTAAEAESAIRAKLLQLYPARGSTLPKGLVDTLMARAQGNPFYLEELLNYVRDRGFDPADLHRIELPDSLHTLILSRIDQLNEREKTTLRVASIVGRLFRAKWLTGYYPELGSMPQVKAALDALDSLDITPLDSPEPELSYLFKHIVTHEVTYESLPFATRARLHEQLARYLEIVDASVDTIVFHYRRSENKYKQREYLRKAGEAAQKSFANDATLEYYGSLLPLLKDAKEKTEIHLKRGQVLELTGKWDEAESDYRAALKLSKDNAALKASTQFALGKLNRLRGEYELALEWLVQAKEVCTLSGDNAELAQVLIETGNVLLYKGEFVLGREPLNEGLILAREVGDKLGAALALTHLGASARVQGDHATARALFEESLNLRRGMGDKWGIASSLNYLGDVAHNQADYATARVLFEESMNLQREMGDKWGIAGSLTHLGNVAYRRGDYATARTLFEESLNLQRAMGDKVSIAVSLNNLGNVAMSQGDSGAGQALYEESLSLCRDMGYKWGMGMSLTNLGNAAYVQGEYVTARAFYEECLALCTEMDEKQIMGYALLGLGLVDLAVNKPEAREHILQSLRLRRETGEQLYQTSSLVGVAGLVLHEGDAIFAAQLLGAVESAIKTLNAVVEEELIPFHTQTLAAIREQLGEAAFQSAWEEGVAWSLEEAVQRVLGQ
jgi:adenylate cyclase